MFYSDSTQNDADLTVNGQATCTSRHGSTFSFTRAEFTYARDKQVAGYGDVDLNVTKAFKVSAGLRVSSDKFYFNQGAA